MQQEQPEQEVRNPSKASRPPGLTGAGSQLPEQLRAPSQRRRVELFILLVTLAAGWVDALAFLFLTRVFASFLTGNIPRMVSVYPSCERHCSKDATTMLMLGAHPDDGALGVGVLAARVVERGMSVILLTATQGELGGDPLIRQAEDGAAAQMLGGELYSGHLHGGQIALHPALALIEAMLRRFNPTIVLVHSPHDSHQDHVCLAEQRGQCAGRSPICFSARGQPVSGSGRRSSPTSLQSGR